MWIVGCALSTVKLLRTGSASDHVHPVQDRAHRDRQDDQDELPLVDADHFARHGLRRPGEEEGVRAYHQGARAQHADQHDRARRGRPTR